MPLDESWALAELYQALQRLASPAVQQRAYLRQLGDVDADELALEFDDIVGTVKALVDAGRITPQLGDAIVAVDQQLATMSREDSEGLWHAEALEESPAWTRVRELAAAALSLWSQQVR